MSLGTVTGWRPLSCSFLRAALGASHQTYFNGAYRLTSCLFWKLRFRLKHSVKWQRPQKHSPKLVTGAAKVACPPVCSRNYVSYTNSQPKSLCDQKHAPKALKHAPRWFPNQFGMPYGVAGCRLRVMITLRTRRRSHSKTPVLKTPGARYGSLANLIHVFLHSR